MHQPSTAEASVDAVRFERDASAFVVSIDGEIEALLGWSAEDLVGKPSTDFIHPDDHATAVTSWFEMMREPGARGRSRVRYQHSDGRWIWIESTNVNRLDDAERPRVETSMIEVERDDLGVEERLRAKDQLLSRLTDALPVGVVQFDSDGLVVASNDRLGVIVGRRDATSLDQLLEQVEIEDQLDLTAAVLSLLDDGVGCDGLEFRLNRADLDRPVVCRASLRSLTDADGTVTGGVATVDDVTDQVRLRDELGHQAAIDHLTGSLNRRSIMSRLDDALDELRTTPGSVAVFFIDLDGFKAFNDTCGHATGDAVLKSVAERLRAVVRDSDHVGRVGGDEFLVVCSRVGGPEQIDGVGRRIASAVNFEFFDTETELSVRASVGVASTANHVPSDTLVESADASMYRCKRAASL